MVAEGAHVTSYPRRWWILAVLSLSVLVIGLDLTVLNVALPTFVQDLQATTSELQWILDAYTLVFAAVLIFAGSLGDRIGRKRVLVAGLAIFLAGSPLGAYAWSTGSLIGARALMGLGAGIILPLTLSLIPVIFNDAERPRAIGIWSAGALISLAIGPIVGGWLLSHFWWGSIFLFNIPFILAALVAVIWLAPESRDARARRMDLPGAVMAAGGLALLIFAIIEQPVRGWDGVTITTLVLGPGLLAGCAWWEAHTHDPVLDPRLFANTRFTWGAIANGLLTVPLAGVMFLLTQYLQDVLGYRPFDAGVRILPLAAGVFIGAAASGVLTTRIGSKLVVAGGGGIMALGLGLFGTTSVQTSYAFVALTLAIVGLGAGVGTPPALDALLGALPQSDFGVGSAIGSAFRQVGAALGVAVLGNLYLNRYLAELRLPEGLPAPVVSAVQQSVGAANVAAGLTGPLGVAVRSAAHSAFIAGMDAALVVSALVTMATAILVLIFLPSRSGTPKMAPVSLGFQETMVLVKGGYIPDLIVVEHGKPVRLNFRREETAACSEMVILNDLGKSAHLLEGEVVPIEFLPEKPGEYEFTCQMGMLRGKLIVE